MELLSSEYYKAEKRDVALERIKKAMASKLCLISVRKW